MFFSDDPPEPKRIGTETGSFQNLSRALKKPSPHEPFAPAESIPSDSVLQQEKICQKDEGISPPSYFFSVDFKTHIEKSLSLIQSFRRENVIFIHHYSSSWLWSPLSFLLIKNLLNLKYRFISVYLYHLKFNSPKNTTCVLQIKIIISYGYVKIFI